MDKQKHISLFDRQAAQYDRQRENPSQKKWRQNLLSQARGNVLELAVGAGANFPFYPSGVRVTATDFSSAMIAKAESAAQRYGIDAEFRCEDVETLSFPDDAFDTVVSTLSLCSYENPARVLANLRRWCKPEGTILLLEHGISPSPLLSRAQKAFDPLLYRMFGCHHDRDIRGLIEASGIRIASEERHWFDMVRIIQAHPQP